MGYRIIIFVLLITGTVSAQSNTGRLEKQLQNASSSKKASILFELMVAYQKSSFATSTTYGRQALDLYKEMNNPSEIINTTFQLGKVHSTARKYSEAAGLYNEALILCEKYKDFSAASDIYEKLGYVLRRMNKYEDAIESYKKAVSRLDEDNYDEKERLAEVYNRIGICYSRLGDYQNTVDYFKSAIELNREMSDKRRLANSLNNLGVTYWKIRDAEKAIEYYFLSLEIKEELGDKKKIASTYNNIGIVYRHMKNFDKALEYYKKSLELKKEMGIVDDASVSNNYNNIGVVYWNMNDYTRALEYYSLALEMEKKRNDRRSMGRSLNNIGVVHKERKEFDKAFSRFYESLYIRSQINEKRGIATVLNNLGQLSFEAGLYDSVLYHINKSMQIAREIKARDLIRNNYGVLINYYKSVNNYKNAFEYSQLFSALNDSINTKESMDLLSELQIKYEVSKKEKEIFTLKEKEKTQLLYIKILIFGLICISLLMMLIIYLYQNNVKTNTLLKNVINSLTYPFSVINAHNGKVEIANTSYREKSTECPKEEVISSEQQSQIDNKFKDFFVEEVKKKKVHHVFELPVGENNGGKRYFEVHAYPVMNFQGKVDKVIEYSFDITERKNAELLIKESEEKFRSLAEQSLLGILIVQEDTIVYVNNTTADIVEYTKEEILQFSVKDLKQILKPKTNSGDTRYLKNALRNKDDDVFNLSYQIITKTGKLKWIEHSSKKIIYNKKEALFISALDISDRMEAEEKVSLLQKQYYRSERLAAIGRLSSSIAHEINNPLQAIIDNIELVEESLGPDFKEIESLNHIVIGIDRITDTVKQLLDISRPKFDVKEKVVINDIINSTLSLLKNQMLIKGIVVIKQFQNSNVKILALRQELFQVFLNLFINAMDAMKNGGRLTIKTELIDSVVEISVGDTGTGILEKEIDHIFEPFFTTKSNMLGTGLGLSTTKGIVESFGGQIDVQSEKGKGTLFIIRFNVFEENK